MYRIANFSLGGVATLTCYTVRATPGKGDPHPVIPATLGEIKCVYVEVLGGGVARTSVGLARVVTQFEMGYQGS